MNTIKGFIVFTTYLEYNILYYDIFYNKNSDVYWVVSYHCKNEESKSEK